MERGTASVMSGLVSAGQRVPLLPKTVWCSGHLEFTARPSLGCRPAVQHASLLPASHLPVATTPCTTSPVPLISQLPQKHTRLCFCPRAFAHVVAC